MAPSFGLGQHESAAAKALEAESIYAAAHILLSREQITDAAHAFRILLEVAPRDERGWLGLGECHERICQYVVALELYGAGGVLAREGGGPSARCFLAQARLLSKIGRDFEPALEAAESAAIRKGDDELVRLVLRERERLS